MEDCFYSKGGLNSSNLATISLDWPFCTPFPTPPSHSPLPPPPPQGLTPTNKFCNVWATFLLLFARLFICLSICLFVCLLPFWPVFLFVRLYLFFSFFFDLALYFTFAFLSLQKQFSGSFYGKGSAKHKSWRQPTSEKTTKSSFAISLHHKAKTCNGMAVYPPIST